MDEVQDIKRLLYPIVKRLPWIILLMIISISLTWRLTAYQNPMFESSSTIRLDDHSTGFSDNNLYRDLDVFSESNDILTEVEMIKSEVVIIQALKLMPTRIDYYRKGKLRDEEIYGITPFTVVYDSANFYLFDELVDVNVFSEEEINIVIDADTIRASFEEVIEYKGNVFQVNKGKAYNLEYGLKALKGEFQFRVNTYNNLLKNYVSGHLFVKEIDKNVGVVTIHFEGEHPKKTADFTNAIATAYLQDHIESKMSAANETEGFLDDRLSETAADLNQAELNLESFRLNNRVLNLKQETETNLRKISQLDIQLTNLRMKLVVLDSLEAYIKEDPSKFLNLAPSFEAYGGLLFTELVKKMKSLESDKIDLENIYSKNSEEIKGIDKKVKDLVDYIIENIQNHKQNTLYQQSKIEADIFAEERDLDNLPTLEKDMIRLERDFQHYHDLFNFLKKKQLEAGIAKTAELNFHRVIKYAKPSSMPASPNKGFNVGLAGFLTLLLTIALVYLIEGIRGKITSRHQIERLTDAKVLGVVKKKAHLFQDGSIDFLLANLLPQLKSNPGLKVSFNSSVSQEGKSYLAHYSAISLARSGRKVLLIDFNSKNYELEKLIVEDNEDRLEHYFLGDLIKDEVLKKTSIDNLSVSGFSMNVDIHKCYLHKDFESKLLSLCEGFDVVLFDNPAYSIAPESHVFLGYSDYKIFIVRQEFTSAKYVKNIQSIVNKYGVEQVGIVINDAPRGVNYSGMYYGSRYHYDQPKGFKQKMLHYWESYRNAWVI